jgi:hypothetical protein
MKAWHRQCVPQFVLVRAYHLDVTWPAAGLARHHDVSGLDLEVTPLVGFDFVARRVAPDDLAHGGDGACTVVQSAIVREPCRLHASPAVERIDDAEDAACAVGTSLRE